MRSYGESCVLSRSLDVIGDRWTLLIVRELLISPGRYSDLLRALPGIATNMLARRLRELEEAGVILCRDHPTQASARMYGLTERGLGLRPALVALAQWGVPLEFRGSGEGHRGGRGIVFAVMALYPDSPVAAGPLPDLTADIKVEGEHLLLVSDAYGVRATLAGSASTISAELLIEGDYDQVFRTLSGEIANRSTAKVSGTPSGKRKLSELVAHSYNDNRRRSPA